MSARRVDIAIKGYLAGFGAAVAGLFIFFLATQNLHGFSALLVLVGLIYDGFAAATGLIVVAETVRRDRWVLHWLAPVQGILVATVSLPLAFVTMMGIGAALGTLGHLIGGVGSILSSIAFIGGGVVTTLIPWLVYLPIRTLCAPRTTESPGDAPSRDSAPLPLSGNGSITARTQGPDSPWVDSGKRVS